MDIYSPNFDIEKAIELINFYIDHRSKFAELLNNSDILYSSLKNGFISFVIDNSSLIQEETLLKMAKDYQCEIWVSDFILDPEELSIKTMYGYMHIKYAIIVDKISIEWYPFRPRKMWFKDIDSYHITADYWKSLGLRKIKNLKNELNHE